MTLSLDWAHANCRAATTANINLSTALENGDLLDGVTLATNDRVLVKNQTTGSQNGIYVVQASGRKGNRCECEQRVRSWFLRLCD